MISLPIISRAEQDPLKLGRTLGDDMYFEGFSGVGESLVRGHNDRQEDREDEEQGNDVEDEGGDDDEDNEDNEDNDNNDTNNNNNNNNNVDVDAEGVDDADAEMQHDGEDGDNVAMSDI